MFPTAFKWAPKIAAPLATGAIQALGSLGIDKLFGSGLSVPKKVSSGGFLIQPDKLQELLPYQNLLTATQNKQFLDALKTAKQFVIKPNKNQRGGFLGTLLASIGIPLLLSALTGKGLSVPKKKAAGLQVSRKPYDLINN